MRTELLEDRRLLATITWDGGGGDADWNNALNWDSDTLPGATDNVIIPDLVPDITITHSFGTTSVNTISSEEAIDLSGGSIAVAAASTINNSMNLGGTGVLAGIGDLTISGPLTWSGGSMDGTGKTIANGGILLTGPADKFFVGRTLENTTSATWDEGRIGGVDGGVFNNPSGATFEITTDDVWFSNGAVGIVTFNNAGTVRKSAGTGTTTMAVHLNNTGRVDVQTGILAFGSRYTQTAGSTILNGGDISSVLPLDIQGGVLTGAGTIVGSVSNGGEGAPGLPLGIIEIQNDYVQGPTGILDVEIGGLVAGTQHDQLDVTGDVTLDGSPNITLVNGFTPGLGVPITIINNDGADAVAGTFAGLAEGSIVSVETNLFQVSYVGGDGNDVVVTRVTLNEPPSVDAISAPVDPLDVSTEVNASANFTDPNVTDTHTAEWDWGDGNTSAGTVDETNGSGSVTGSHTYTQAGVYTVTLTVTDNEGAQGTSIFEFIVVFDPSAGFVTGGGWIDSPEGAYIADTTLTGQANFGFFAKYKNGANIPTGQTHFQFSVADLKFQSDIYQWLVVAGARAQYKGTGTINGQGNYGFKLTAIDGQINGGGGADKFRMKIWDKDNNDALVYDNQLGLDDNDNPTTVLGGGSIVIHKNGQALHVLGGEGDGALIAATLTPSMLDTAVDEAIAQWSVAGIAENRLDALSHVDIQIAELSGSLLGVASSSNIIWIDRDAAGYGWATDGSEDGIDLPSVVAHELGHKLGLGHDVLGERLAVGATQLPWQANEVASTEADNETDHPSIPGDVNGDSVFDRLDIAQVLQAGKYLVDEPAVWRDGDWNHDGVFDQLDIVAALQTGSFVHLSRAALGDVHLIYTAFP